MIDVAHEAPSIQEEEAKREVASLYSRLDNPEPPRPARELARDIENTFPRIQDQLSPITLEHLQWEYLALSMVIRTSIISLPAENSPNGSKRLTGFLQFENGKTFPDPDTVSAEMLDYLTERAEKTSNPVVRAQYNDILWEKLRRHPSALAAIDAYLESARLFAASSRPFSLLEASVLLDHAVHLTLAIQDRSRVDRLVAEVMSLIRKQTSATLEGRDTSHPPGRWVVELSKIALYVRERLGGPVVGDETLKDVLQADLDLADQNAARGDRWGEQEFLRLAARAAQLSGDGETVFHLRLRMGKSLEREALTRATGPNPSHLAAAGLYEMALNHYERLRSDQHTPHEHREELLHKEAELKRKIREQYRLGGTEWGVIRMPVGVPKDELDLLLGALLQPSDLMECLKLVASEGSLLPNVELAEQRARQAAAEQHLTHLIPRTLVVDGIPTLQVPALDRKTGTITSGGSGGAEEVNEQTVDPVWLSNERNRNLLLWIGINATAVLSPLFARLRGRGLNAEILTDYVGSYSFVDENNLQIISVGFERYFSEDYVSAIHILAPQFEDVLRTLFERSGMPTMNRRRGATGWQLETNFGEFLRFSEVQGVVPPEILEYIRLVMADPAGWNLRNRVAHGLINPEECVEPILDTILHLYLILGQFRLEPGIVDTPE